MRGGSLVAVTAPARVAWFHCFSGIAGDMALGALIDAGADLGFIKEQLDALGISGVSLETTRVLRAGLSATRALVHAEDDGSSRRYGDIVEILQSAALVPRVRERALLVFGALARVEGTIHGVAPDDVHFHEVGGHDAIVDIVGTCAALESLAIEALFSSPVAQGRGMVRSAHGAIPNPSPAVLALLEGAPTYGREIELELTTPTGAALLAALDTTFSTMPAMTLVATGYGAGGRDLDGWPNVTQVVIGELATNQDAAAPIGQPLVVIEANLDDVTGEQLADAIATLMAAGANDAWVSPAVMKKGRPAHVLSVLADPVDAPRLREIVLEETGSFGLRQHLVDRYAVRRAFEQVELDGATVNLKVSARHAKVEHDDALAIARARGTSVREVIARAEQAWRARKDAPKP
jgi:uncharacterized protein (TIGR00299 family) protein